MDGVMTRQEVDDREQLDRECRELLPQLRELLRDWETLKSERGCPVMGHILNKQ